MVKIEKLPFFFFFNENTPIDNIINWIDYRPLPLGKEEDDNPHI